MMQAKIFFKNCQGRLDQLWGAQLHSAGWTQWTSGIAILDHLAIMMMIMWWWCCWCWWCWWSCWWSWWWLWWWRLPWSKLRTWWWWWHNMILCWWWFLPQTGDFLLGDPWDEVDWIYLAAADQGGEGDGDLQGPENGGPPLEGPQKAPRGVSKAPRGPVRSHTLSPTSSPPEPPEAPPSPANFCVHSLKGWNFDQCWRLCWFSGWWWWGGWPCLVGGWRGLRRESGLNQASGYCRWYRLLLVLDTRKDTERGLQCSGGW